MSDSVHVRSSAIARAGKYLTVNMRQHCHRDTSGEWLYLYVDKRRGHEVLDSGSIISRLNDTRIIFDDDTTADQWLFIDEDAINVFPLQTGWYIRIRVINPPTRQRLQAAQVLRWEYSGHVATKPINIITGMPPYFLQRSRHAWRLTNNRRHILEIVSSRPS